MSNVNIMYLTMMIDIKIYSKDNIRLSFLQEFYMTLIVLLLLVKKKLKHLLKVFNDEKVLLRNREKEHLCAPFFNKKKIP